MASKPSTRAIASLADQMVGMSGVQQKQFLKDIKISTREQFQRLEEQKRRQEEDKKTRDAMQRKVFELVWSLPSIEMMEDVLEGVKSQMRQRQSACEEQDESAIEDEDDEDADGDWDM